MDVALNSFRKHTTEPNQQELIPIGKRIMIPSRQMLHDAHEPTFTVLRKHMILEEGGTVQLENFQHPKLVAEIAFVIGKSLKGPIINISQVLNAIAYVVPVIAISDNFVSSTRDSLDNTTVILGKKSTAINRLDLRHLGVVIDRNGVQVVTGAGAAVLGNPLRALIWLVNYLTQDNKYLEKGQIILSGAITNGVDVQANETYTAHFEYLGSVTISS